MKTRLKHKSRVKIGPDQINRDLVNVQGPGLSVQCHYLRSDNLFNGGNIVEDLDSVENVS